MLSLTLLLCSVAPGCVGCESRQAVGERFAQFLTEQRVRERAAQQHLIAFTQWSYESNSTAPGMLGCGTCQFLGDFEKWTRYDIVRASVEPQELTLSPTETLTRVSAGLNPRIYQCDGGRVLALEPHKTDRKLWKGILSADLNTNFRSGALNCGLMFGEQWLSQYLSSYAPVEGGETAGAREFVLAPSQPADSPDRITLGIDDHGAPNKVLWMKGGKLVVCATVSEFQVIDGQYLATSGEISYNYSPNMRLRVTLEYKPLQLGSGDRDVLACPAEVVSVDGAMIVEDAATLAKVRKGNPEVLAKYPAMPSGKHDKPGSVPDRAHLPLVALGLGLVGLCGGWFLWSRRRHASRRVS